LKDIKTILVPVDFSDASRQALDYAQDLAVALGARLHLLHVWEIPPYIPPEAMVGIPGQTSQTLSRAAQSHAEEQMRVLAAAAREAGAPIDETKLESGDPARTIVEVAESGGYDLIVMGTHGRTGIGHLLMGSVAEKVLRRTSCPVLSVRVPAQGG
jgi:universal stress protein A